MNGGKWDGANWLGDVPIEQDTYMVDTPKIGITNIRITTSSVEQSADDMILEIHAT